LNLKNNLSVLKALALCVGFFSFAACKERSVIKPDLIPGIDNINTFGKSISDFDVSINQGSYDSFRTDDYRTPLVALGSIAQDPFFGKTFAGFYFQIHPPLANFTFPDDLTSIDSVVLAVPYARFSYGDDNIEGDLQAINVYRITDANFGTGDTAVKRYAFDQVAINPTPLSSALVSLDDIINDSVTYAGGAVIRNTMRIKMPTSLGEDFAQLDTAVLANSTAFTEYFKGLYVAPDTTASLNYQRRISYFVLDTASAGSNFAKARMEIYYKKTDGSHSLILFPYKIGPDAMFSHIHRNYQSFPAQQFNPGTVHDSIALQSFPGMYSEITLNNIQDIPLSVINKAQLTLTVLKVGNDDIYLPSQQLILSGVNEDGSSYTISDYYDNAGINGSLTSYVGGTPSTVTIDGTQYLQYKINFPRELQKAVLERKESLKLRISSVTNYYGAYRLVADGLHGPEATRLKFDVVYSLH